MARVLIVDDKEDNLYYLRALMAGHGHVVDSAHHGAEALVRARQHPPDVVISDLLMPVMDGYALLRHWKADANLRRVPFIVYTATYTNPEDERLAVSLGADAFILKPAEPDDFLARFQEVRDRGVSSPPAQPHFPEGGEQEILKVYSQTLIRKLEEKTLQLEEANRALQEDVARRRRVEEDLRESEERFRATFEQAAVGIAHVGVDGRFLRVNDKLCAITGHSRDGLLHRAFADLSVPEDRLEVEEARLAMLAGQRDFYSTEKRHLRRDGGVIWGSVFTSLLRDPAGAPKYFISVIADVTERRLLQEQLLRAQRMESIGTLAGGVAHDLNNVLAPILMAVELLKSTVTDEGGLAVLGTMQRSAQRGADLVRQVLSFARGVEGERVCLNLVHISRDLVDVICETFPKSIRVEFVPIGDVWTVAGDPTQMHQVLLNLCVNARDAMPGGGRLVVTLQNALLDETYAAMNIQARPGAYVALSVEDTGTGIPPKIRDKIFEPFFTTKEVGKGTGLGLSTIMAIVKSHHGFINVYSEVGRGTKFKVYLPASTGSAGSAPPAGPERLPCGQGELVLLVDDEEAIRNVAQRTLERFGYHVLVAGNGAEALALYAAHRAEVRLVLTDMAMPIMDGPALIIALRVVNPAVKIIASSGLSANGGASPVGGVGPDRFVPKPYTAEVLLKAVNDVLKSEAAGGAASR